MVRRSLTGFCQQLKSTMESDCMNTSKQLTLAIQQVSDHNKDLIRKYRKEMVLRKKYHNELVELKG